MFDGVQAGYGLSLSLGISWYLYAGVVGLTQVFRAFTQSLPRHATCFRTVVTETMPSFFQTISGVIQRLYPSSTVFTVITISLMEKEK